MFALVTPVNRDQTLPDMYYARPSLVSRHRPPVTAAHHSIHTPSEDSVQWLLDRILIFAITSALYGIHLTKKIELDKPYLNNIIHDLTLAIETNNDNPKNQGNFIDDAYMIIKLKAMLHQTLHATMLSPAYDSNVPGRIISLNNIQRVFSVLYDYILKDATLKENATQELADTITKATVDEDTVKLEWAFGYFRSGLNSEMVDKKNLTKTNVQEITWFADRVEYINSIVKKCNLNATDPIDVFDDQRMIYELHENLEDVLLGLREYTSVHHTDIQTLELQFKFIKLVTDALYDKIIREPQLINEAILVSDEMIQNTKQFLETMILVNVSSESTEEDTLELERAFEGFRSVLNKEMLDETNLTKTNIQEISWFADQMKHINSVIMNHNNNAVDADYKYDDEHIVMKLEANLDEITYHELYTHHIEDTRALNSRVDFIKLVNTALCNAIIGNTATKQDAIRESNETIQQARTFVMKQIAAVSDVPVNEDPENDSVTTISIVKPVKTKAAEDTAKRLIFTLNRAMTEPNLDGIAYIKQHQDTFQMFDNILYFNAEQRRQFQMQLTTEDRSQLNAIRDLLAANNLFETQLAIVILEMVLYSSIQTTIQTDETKIEDAIDTLYFIHWINQYLYRDITQNPQNQIQNNTYHILALFSNNILNDISEHTPVKNADVTVTNDIFNTFKDVHWVTLIKLTEVENPGVDVDAHVALVWILDKYNNSIQAKPTGHYFSKADFMDIYNCIGLGRTILNAKTVDDKQKKTIIREKLYALTNEYQQNKMESDDKSTVTMRIDNMRDVYVDICMYFFDDASVQKTTIREIDAVIATVREVYKQIKLDVKTESAHSVLETILDRYNDSINNAIFENTLRLDPMLSTDIIQAKTVDEKTKKTAIIANLHKLLDAHESFFKDLHVKNNNEQKIERLDFIQDAYTDLCERLLTNTDTRSEAIEAIKTAIIDVDFGISEVSVDQLLTNCNHTTMAQIEHGKMDIDDLFQKLDSMWIKQKLNPVSITAKDKETNTKILSSLRDVIGTLHTVETLHGSTKPNRVEHLQFVQTVYANICLRFIAVTTVQETTMEAIYALIKEAVLSVASESTQQNADVMPTPITSPPPIKLTDEEIRHQYQALLEYKFPKLPLPKLFQSDGDIMNNINALKPELEHFDKKSQLLVLFDVLHSLDLLATPNTIKDESNMKRILFIRNVINMLLPNVDTTVYAHKLINHAFKITEETDATTRASMTYLPDDMQTSQDAVLADVIAKINAVVDNAQELRTQYKEILTRENIKGTLKKIFKPDGKLYTELMAFKPHFRHLREQLQLSVLFDVLLSLNLLENPNKTKDDNKKKRLGYIQRVCNLLVDDPSSYTTKLIDHALKIIEETDATTRASMTYLPDDMQTSQDAVLVDVIAKFNVVDDNAPETNMAEFPDLTVNPTSASMEDTEMMEFTAKRTFTHEYCDALNEPFQFIRLHDDIDTNQFSNYLTYILLPLNNKDATIRQLNANAQYEIANRYNNTMFYLYKCLVIFRMRDRGTHAKHARLCIQAFRAYWNQYLFACGARGIIPGVEKILDDTLDTITAPTKIQFNIGIELLKKRQVEVENIFKKYWNFPINHTNDTH